MASYKFTALAEQVTRRRVNHLHRYQRAGKPKASTVTPPRRQSRTEQLGMFEDKPALEVFNQYDPNSRDVEWAFYSKDGCFLLQFGFSLKDRHYRIYSIHAALFHDNAEMVRHLSAINENLRGHYPALQLVCDPNQGPEIKVLI